MHSACLPCSWAVAESCKTFAKQDRTGPFPLGELTPSQGVFPWGQLKSLGSGTRRYGCGTDKFGGDLVPGAVWLLSQDRKSPSLEPWGMKALEGRAWAGLEAKAALPALAMAELRVGTGELWHQVHEAARWHVHVAVQG